MKFYYYSFQERENGKYFFIECRDFDEALDILYDNNIMWADVDFLGACSSAEVELLGYGKRPTAHEIEDFWHDK